MHYRNVWYYVLLINNLDKSTSVTLDFMNVHTCLCLYVSSSIGCVFTCRCQHTCVLVCLFVCICVCTCISIGVTAYAHSCVMH